MMRTISSDERRSMSRLASSRSWLMEANDIIALVATSFMQKIRLALRGWSRRREEQQSEFLRKNVSWGSVAPPIPAASAGEIAGATLKTIDLDGLQAAYLDGSGLIAYYLDVETGDVVERRDQATLDANRYKRVPARTSENDERRALIETLEPSRTRELLMKSVVSANFRSVLAGDRTAERAWYNFRNASASASPACVSTASLIAFATSSAFRPCVPRSAAASDRAPSSSPLLFSASV